MTMTVFSDKLYIAVPLQHARAYIEAYSSVLEHMREYSECRRPSRLQCNADSQPTQVGKAASDWHDCTWQVARSGDFATQVSFS